MAALLVVLVVVCALGIAVHLARGLWARTRSVHRHQQALDTLADITQSAGGTAQAGALDGSQHQAHVRVLGPSGEPSPTEVPVLPPPKPLAPNEHASQSPFRRPSRSGLRSGAGAQAALAAGTNSLHMRPTAPPPVAPPITPPDGPIGADDIPPDDVTRVIPGLTPPPPPKAPDEPTRPVPVIRPHVFYFDDLSARSNQAKESAPAKAASAGDESLAPSAASASASASAAGTALPSTAARRGSNRQRRLAAQALVAASVALVVAGGAVYLAVEGSGQSPRRVGAPKTSNPVASTGGRSTPASTSAPASTNPPTSSTSTSTTVTTLPKPVQLISSVKNAATGTTDTYRLGSSTASIVVKAAGPCWVEVRVGGPAGQVKVEETLQAGEQATVSGAAWIRLGDPPYASVLVDGTPTTVPGSKSGVPLNLNFTVS
jgi:hypothetical protein